METTLAVIINNLPFLIPYVIFQKFDTKDLLGNLHKADLLWIFFQRKESPYCLLEVLMKVLLCRDTSNLLLIVASFIENCNIKLDSNEETTGEDAQISNKTDLRYLIIIRIFKIIEDMLDVQETMDISLEVYESMFLNYNISYVISYLSVFVEKNMTEHKEKITELVVGIVQKLFKKPDLLALCISRTPLVYNIIDIISSIIHQHQDMNKVLDQAKTKYSYIGILKTLDEPNIEISSLQATSSCIFDSFIFEVEDPSDKRKEQTKKQEDFKATNLTEKDRIHKTRRFLQLYSCTYNSTDIPNLEMPLKKNTIILRNKDYNQVCGDNNLTNILQYYIRYEKNRNFNNKEREHCLNFHKNQVLKKRFFNFKASYSQGFRYDSSHDSKPSVLKVDKASINRLINEIDK